MDAGWVERKLKAVYAAWNERFGANPMRSAAAMALAVARYETVAGDVWPGENNWGAVQRPDGVLHAEEKQKIEAHDLWPAEDPRTKEGAARLEKARALVSRAGGGLHIDSSPGKGWYYVFFYAFETEAEGASLFLKILLSDRPTVNAVIGGGDARKVADAMYRTRYFEGVHDPSKSPDGKPPDNGFPRKGELNAAQKQNVEDYGRTVQALYEEIMASKSPDLSFRKLIPGESKADRLVRMDVHMASLSAAEMRALLEPGAQTAQWTCMVRARAAVWHACCLPDDGMDKIIVVEFKNAEGKPAKMTFGKYGDDEDRTIFNCILYPSNDFVWARPGTGNKLPLAVAAIGWQSAPAGGNDHVVLICSWEDLGGGRVRLKTVEGGQVNPDTQVFTREWLQRADGRWDNVGAHGSPTPGTSIVQGIAYPDKWPILTAPEEASIDLGPVGTLPPEAPTKPDSPAVMPETDPFPTEPTTDAPVSNVSRETLPEVSKSKLTAVHYAALALFGGAAALVGWLLRHC